MTRRCSIEDCDRPVKAREWCAAHYKRWRVHGDPHTIHIPPDWSDEQIELLMSARLTAHTARYAGPDPEESLAAVAAKLGRSISACRSKRMKLERERGHTVGDQWTDEGLWTPDEDKVIRDHMAAPGERAPVGTWPAVALHLGRTPAAVRTRACALRRADCEA